MTSGFRHEQVLVRTGRRSGVPIVVAVHSTARGRAVGGARMWPYPRWQDGLEDALRLSEAMTLKCAVSDLPHGGGKAVVALPGGLPPLPAATRREVMLDLGDAVDGLGGTFGVGADVGTGAADLLIARERTRWAYCLPAERGGVGETAEPTAVGVLEAVRSTAHRVFGRADLAGLRVTVLGFGQVGARLASDLVAAGVVLTACDVVASKRSQVETLGARWLDPDEALVAETDVLVPAALGGVLTAATVERLRCRAVVGPANNQLAADGVADLLAARGILWAPDFLVNAGGVIVASTVDVDGGSMADAMAHVRGIGERLSRLYDRAEADGITPLAAALRIAGERLAAAGTPP